MTTETTAAPAVGSLWHNNYNVGSCPEGSLARVQFVEDGRVFVRVVCAGVVGSDCVPLDAFAECYEKPDDSFTVLQLRECQLRIGRYLRLESNALHRRELARLRRLEAYLRARVNQ